MVSSLSALRESAETAPLDHIRWTLPQLEWLRDAASRKLLRTGNQLGKTTAGLAEVDYRCTGRHPFYATHEPPIEAWVVCASWSQSVAIQKKFDRLCSRNDIDWERTPLFDDKNGFGAKNPTVFYKNGSVVKFKTTQQGALMFAGATIHYVHIDEPTTQRVYTELSKRVSRTGGAIGLTLTPINGPVDWLKKLCEKGVIEDHHFRLEARHLIPQDAQVPLRTESGELMDEAWVDRQIAETPEDEVPVVIHGEWETREGGRRLPLFSDAHNLVDDAGLPTEVTEIRLSMDHGEGVGKQTAYLTLFAAEQAWVAREWVSPVASPTRERIAQAIADMLESLGITPFDIDVAYGDINAVGLGASQGGQKYNDLIAEALCSHYGWKSGLPFPFTTPAKRRGSVKAGEAAMNHAFGERRLWVHEGCVHFRKAAYRYTGKASDDHKDKIDGVRYGLEDWLLADVGGGGSLVRHA